MDCLISTVAWSQIVVVPQVDKQLLIRANIPSRWVWPSNARNSPLNSITRPRESAIRVLRRLERHSQGHDSGVRLHFNIGIKLAPGDQLDELPVDDVELAGASVVVHDGGTSGVFGVGL